MRFDIKHVLSALMMLLLIGLSMSAQAAFCDDCNRAFQDVEVEKRFVAKVKSPTGVQTIHYYTFTHPEYPQMSCVNAVYGEGAPFCFHKPTTAPKEVPHE